MSNDVMIECQSLTKRFGTFTAVDNVSFAIAKGSIFGFLGPNGSGKSTVIRMLCGILEPTAGTANVAGVDVVRHADQLKGKIGYMSQKFSLYDELTVWENLTFYGRLYGLRATGLRERIHEVIELTHLQPYISRRAALLSGGWRQRLAMGCALLHKPAVLFLDEPTAGIDPVARRELWDLLFEFSSVGMTLFVTTHYMDEAERCSHVGYIHMSKLVVCGVPDDLKHLPVVSPPGTRRLDVNCEHVTVGLQALRRLPGVHTATVFGQSMHLLVDRALSEQTIRARLSEAGIDDADIRPIGPSLEDVFVALTTEPVEDGALQ
ncbi:MAG: ABC transporter ATP-binding protein [Verrucomicrobia subdivision 3 bacterium]|nr:ABC transporter ATP-binding protein [Limisphaerales bacterium]